jgi:hypothetical protein
MGTIDMQDKTRPIHFTHHARLRMAQRSVSEAQVEQAIRAGFWRPNSPEGWIASALVDGRQLNIVFVEQSTPEGQVVIEVLLVVTVVEVAKGRGH